jgi:caffeoyl-CoA O-methyltransferase
MELVNPAIEAYAEASTTPAPDYLVKLDADTAQELGSPQMLSGVIVGRFLETLVRVSGARRVLEIGTFSGGSALWMARGLAPDGRIVTCEVDAERAAFAQERIDAAGETERIDIRVGPALETIASLDGEFDLVFIDADKDGYPAYLDASLARLAPNGLIVADNMLRGGSVIEEGNDEPATRAINEFNARVANDPSLISVLLTVRDGLTLVRRA